MILKELVTRLANRLKVDEKSVDERGVSIRQRLIDVLSESYLEIGNSHDWDHLKKMGELQLTPNYTTGTVVVTNGSNTVTGTGSTWTSGMQGRYFKFAANNNWYKIAYVDAVAQVLYLTLPIIESSASGQAYTIWKRFTYLDSEVRKIIDLESYFRQGVLIDVGTRTIQDMTSTPSNTGNPIYFSMFGVDSFTGVYSAGTITLSKDTNLVVGVGTAFLSNVTPGDILKVGALYLRVNRVETDTRLITYNLATSDFSSAQPYTIVRDHPLGFQTYYQADIAYNLPFQYYKKVFPLLNDSERTEFPEIFDLTILDGGEANYLRSINSPSWALKDQEYKARITDLTRSSLVDVPRYRTFSPYIPTRSGY